MVAVIFLWIFQLFVGEYVKTASCLGMTSTAIHDQRTPSPGINRRNMLSSIKNGFAAGFIATGPLLVVFPTPSFAKNTEKDKKRNGSSSNDEAGLLTAEELASRLKVVPTFMIVDKVGAPFMVVGEDAKLSAYFFTTYGEANRILNLATKSADKGRGEAIKDANADRKKNKKPPLSSDEIESEFGKNNPWSDARISTIPLDFAVTLTFVASGRKSGSYFYVQPAEEDAADSLQLDQQSGKKELAEGKVPLFYVEDMTLKDTKETPVYFRKSQLIQEWQTQNNSGKNNKKNDTPPLLPEIKVTELNALIKEMVKPGGVDQDLKTITFVPPQESAKRALECIKKGGDEAPFKIGERIVVL